MKKATEKYGRTILTIDNLDCLYDDFIVALNLLNENGVKYNVVQNGKFGVEIQVSCSDEMYIWLNNKLDHMFGSY
jgi:hypothetical protein